MKLSILTAAAMFGLASVAVAFAQEPQEVRQETMKKIGGATGAMGKMVKGETEFDQQAVLAALQTISENIEKIPELFPAGSEAGMDTEAAPAIWENKEDFKARAMKLKADADAAIAAQPASLDDLRTLFGPLTDNCSGCHENYRLKKDG